MSLPPFAVELRKAAELCAPEQRVLKAKVLSGSVAIEKLSRSLRWMIAMHIDRVRVPVSRFDIAVLEYAKQVLECYGDASDKTPFVDANNRIDDSDRCG